MRIFVFSDTHGKIDACVDAIEKLGCPDLILHLGDVLSDIDDLQAAFPDIEMECVAGNNDFFSTQPVLKIIEKSGKRLMLSHGHMYNVRSAIKCYESKARSEKVDIALFGHTHVPYNNADNGVWLFNPGSTSMPERGAGTFGVIEIVDGQIQAGIHEV